MTKSTGQTGLILPGSPPNFFIACLMAAKSTTAGTPLQKFCQKLPKTKINVREIL